MTPKEREEVYQKLRQWQKALSLPDSDTGLVSAEPSATRLQPKPRQNDLKLYEQLLGSMMADAIARQSGLRESDRHELQALKQVLHLPNEDVAEIEHRLTNQSAATVLPSDLSKGSAAPTISPSNFNPSTAISSTEIPSAQIPSAQIPSAEIPAAEIPAAQIPSVQIPSAEIPSAQIPSAEIPAAETTVPSPGEVNPSANLTGVKGQVVKRKADMEGISAPANSTPADPAASPKSVASQPAIEISAREAIAADQTTVAPTKSSANPAEDANSEKPKAQPDRRPLFITLGLLLPLLGLVGGIWLSLRPNSGGGAVSTDPKLAQQFFESGTQRNQQGQYAAAIKDFDQAIRFNAQDANTFLNRGFAQHRVGNLNAAVDDYTKALAINNRLAEAFSNRSHARFDQRQQDAALKDAAQAIALQPKLAVAHLNLGNALFAQGNLDGAFQKFSQTLQLNPSNSIAARAHNNQGNVFAGQKKLDEAISAYSQAIQLDATYADALFNRAFAFEQKGNRQAAIDDLRAAAALYKAAGNTGMTNTVNRQIEQLQKSPAPAPTPSTQAI